MPEPKQLEAPEANEIKASVSGDILDEAPAPSDAPAPSNPNYNDVPAGELHDVQEYQPSNMPQSTLPQPSQQLMPAPAITPAPSSLPQTLAAPPELVGRTDMDKIQQLAESIIHEKWEEFSEKVGNIEVWKDKTENNITSLKQELIRTQHRFENLEKAVLHKVTDYNKTMESVNTEMKALEKVFEKIVEPLTDSIKELKKLTKDLKK